MFNFKSLNRVIEFGGSKYYIPDDPFGIYLRLLKIFVKSRRTYTKTTRPLIVYERLVQPINLFKQLPRDYQKANDSFSFLIWIQQSLPEKFWLYNNFITANIEQLEQSAKDFDEKQVWIDMPGIKNKIKLCFLTDNIVEGLNSGRFVIPTYEEIRKQIYSWGKKTQYKYGEVKEVLI